MAKVFDLAIVGGGPGGLAAAKTAATRGLNVCLVDDNPALGGQIWREKLVPNAAHGPVSQWLSEVGHLVTVLAGWRAVALVSSQPKILRLESEGKWLDIQCSKLILATGARERFLPFPGWTLPGVYGAGGLQAFVKSGLEVAGKRVVVAGTGPLLLAVGSALTKAGARVVAIVEQTSFAKLARFALGLVRTAPAKVLEGVGYGWNNRRIPYRTGSWISAALGDGHVRAVQITNGSRTEYLDVDMLATGFHLVANTELAAALGCQIANGFVEVDDLQCTSVADVYCVGEATGIGGLRKAQIEGRIAGMAAAGNAAHARALAPARDRELKFARSLATGFELRNELRGLPRAETVVCRCEDVDHQSLCGRPSWREAKLHARCGMGPCQGRVCGPATQFLYGWTPSSPRPPLFPTDIGTLAQPIDSNDPAEAVTAAPKD